jgi:patatin-like phospholipase/acyl hydrolase
MWYNCPVNASEELLRPPGDRFQILALDGGGIRGIFSAALLDGLEVSSGTAILDHFDLIVGTSTGGIIALALAAGFSPAEIVDVYVAEMRSIFPGPKLWRTGRQLIRSKYSSAGLERVARRLLGDRLLGESPVPIVIPSFDLGESTVHLFKTPHSARLKRDHTIPMWQVAMATAAAPTFFPTFCLPGDEIRLIDGGVWANNPAMVGVTEAVSMFGQPLQTIRVLSIGTTTEAKVRRRNLDRGGLLQWARSPNVVDVLMSGQSVGAFTQVQHLIGPGHAHRLDPPAPAGLASLDRVDARDLLAKAAHHSRHFSPVFDGMFADHRAIPYMPAHGPLTKQVIG